MPDWINKHRFILAIAILILAAVFYSAGLNNRLNFFEDGAIYIMMARYLMPVHASDNTEPRIKGFANNYPQGYPAMLSPLTYLFPKNYLVLRFLTYSFSLFFILFIILTYKSFFKDELSAMVIPLIALSPQLAYYSAEILTEIPYILFSTLAIYLIQNYIRGPLSEGILYLFSGCAAVFIAFNIRQIGMALILSIPVLFLARKEFKRGAIFTALVLIWMIFWAYFNIFVHRLPYVTEFTLGTGNIADFLRRWLYNLIATVGKELPDLYSYPFLSAIDPYDTIFIIKFVIGCVLAMLIAIGFVAKIKKEGIGFIEVYTVIYFFVFYLSWTHHGGRYLMPILLFLTYYLILGFKKIIPEKKFLYAIFSFLLLLNLAGDIRWLIVKRVSPFEPVEKSFIEAADWIKKNSGSKEIILSRRPSWLFVYTGGRIGLKFLRTKNTQAQYKYIVDNKIDYLIIDQALIYRDNARDYLLPLVSAYKYDFEKVYQTHQLPETIIYRVKKVR